jgi:hypothetical protein
MRDLSREPSPDLRLFGVLSLDSHGIFMTDRLIPVTRRPPSLVPLPLPNSGTVTTHGGLISPQSSESQFSATNNGFKPIDPTKVRDCHIVIILVAGVAGASCRTAPMRPNRRFSFPRMCSDPVFPILQPLHKRECAPSIQSSLVFEGETD